MRVSSSSRSGPTAVRDGRAALDVARLRFDAEMVVEHEHEQEVQAQQANAAAKSSGGTLDASLIWHVGDLIDSTGPQGQVFVPLSSIMLNSTDGASTDVPSSKSEEQTTVSMPFPAHVLVSQQHTLVTNSDEGPCRLKNVTVVLEWSVVTWLKTPVSTCRTVLISLSEAETMWHALRRNEVIQDGRAKAMLGTALSSLSTQHEEWDDSDSGNAPSRVGIRLTTLDGVVLAHAEVGVGLLSASVVPLPWDPAKLRVGRVCARLFDCTPWFSPGDLKLLLCTLASSPDDGVEGSSMLTRRHFMQALLACRRRDRQNWRGTPLATFLNFENYADWSLVATGLQTLRDAVVTR